MSVRVNISRPEVVEQTIIERRKRDLWLHDERPAPVYQEPLVNQPASNFRRIVRLLFG